MTGAEKFDYEALLARAGEKSLHSEVSACGIRHRRGGKLIDSRRCDFLCAAFCESVSRSEIINGHIFS